MKKIYQVNWGTKKIETATLINENNLNEGATRETWLCKDSKGRKFTCRKNYYQFSELDAWKQYEEPMDGYCEDRLAEIAKLQKEYEELKAEHLRVKRKIADLSK